MSPPPPPARRPPQARVGEVLDGRYEVFATHGRGVFSSVLRVRDQGSVPPGEEVAIKVIRANETMTKAAAQEITILRKLAGADPEGRRHCVRLLRSFEFRSHVFLAFESMHMNLREVLRKFGRNVGLSVGAVHAYAQQLLIALKHLRNCGVLHADIKPDNILVNERRNVLKLADFGSAAFDGDNEITPYLVSRFYRAPEIILGLPYSHPLDVWSLGCVLYELYTGVIAFPGGSNNEMLKLMIEVKGPFPKKMLRRAMFRERHFDADLTFGVLEEDPITRRDVRRLIRETKPTRTLDSSLGRGGALRDLGEADRKRVAHLVRCPSVARCSLRGALTARAGCADCARAVLCADRFARQDVHAGPGKAHHRQPGADASVHQGASPRGVRVSALILLIGFSGWSWEPMRLRTDPGSTEVQHRCVQGG